MWGYNDENGPALRKVVMRKRIRLEEFIFLRLPVAAAAARDVTAWYSRRGVRAHYSVPLNIYGGSVWKGLDVEGSDTVVHVVTTVWKVPILL